MKFEGRQLYQHGRALLSEQRSELTARSVIRALEFETGNFARREVAAAQLL